MRASVGSVHQKVFFLSVKTTRQNSIFKVVKVDVKIKKEGRRLEDRNPHRSIGSISHKGDKFDIQFCKH